MNLDTVTNDDLRSNIDTIGIAAGLTQVEMAIIMGVSRATMNKWYKGAGVHPMLEPKLIKVLRNIVRLTQTGTLPVSIRVGQSARNRIVNTLRLAADKG